MLCGVGHAAGIQPGIKAWSAHTEQVWQCWGNPVRMGVFPSLHTQNRNASVGKPPCWRAASDTSSPGMAAEPLQCPGLSSVGSSVGKEPFHHQGKQRGTREANWGPNVPSSSQPGLIRMVLGPPSLCQR